MSRRTISEGLAVKTLLAICGCLFLATPVALAESREDKAERLIKQLDAKEPKARASAAKELGELTKIKSSLGKPAVKSLVKLLEDKDTDVRAAAVETACLCDEPKEVVAPVIKMLKDEKEDKVKVAAVTGLGIMGESAKDALPTVRELGMEARKGKNNRLAQACRTAAESMSGRTRQK